MRYLFFILLISFNFTSNAKDAFPKWGDISLEDLKMTSYLADPTAAAVVLSDNGLYSAEYERQVRIKVLNKSAFTGSEIIIPYFTSDNSSFIGEVKVHTVYLDENGQKATVELDKKMIFDQHITKYFHAIKFTFPAIKDGCVLEYYVKKQLPGFVAMGPWDFNGEYPVRESSLTTNFPDFFVFKMILTGGIPFYSTTSEHYNGRNSAGFTQFASRYNYAGNIESNFIVNTYTMRNLPAIKHENYCPNYRDYYSRLTFHLEKVAFSGQRIIEIIKDWNNLGKEVRESDYIGRRIKTSNYFETLANSLVNGKTTTDEKIKAIYDYVRNSITWNNYKTIYAYNDLKSVIEDKSGTSGEINLLLISLLRSAGLDANMVLISTIDNGLSQSELPVIHQFNNVIAVVHDSNSSRFLDATDSKRTYEYLDSEDLVPAGLEIKKDSVDWLFIEQGAISKSFTTTNVTVEENGKANATIDLTATGYLGIDYLEDFHLGEENNFVKNTLNLKSQQTKIESVEVLMMDSVNSNFKLKSNFSTNLVSEEGRIFFSPFTHSDLQSNPFEISKRKYPINFLFPERQTNILNITIPDGYTVIENIENTKVVYPDSGISFSCFYNLDGQHLQLKTIFDRSRTFFDPEEYTGLSEFYGKMIGILTRQIVLEKQVTK